MAAAFDESQSRAARVAGLAFLFAMVLVILSNYAISFRLIVPGNAAATARNILDHETLFRLNIACDLLYLLTLLALLIALYVVLRPSHGPLAKAAALCRLVVALMWGMTALNALGALRLLDGATQMHAFSLEQVQILARLRLAASYDAYYVGLPFWGLASAICSYLWFRSGYVPRTLAVFGLVASSWGVFCAITFIILPRFDRIVGASWYDLPLALFEVTLGVWLLVRGLGPTKPAEA